MQLQEPVFVPIPLKQIKPQGWLKRQLRIQADGLSGHLDEFWPDVKDSRWFGGDSEGWERAPYWLDGFLPLAYLLEDDDLIAKAERYIEYILGNQTADGWLGPRKMVIADGKPEEANYDVWAQMLALKVLVQYHDITGDQRVVSAVQRNLEFLDQHIDRTSLFNWGQFRWFETLIAIYWLYEQIEEPWLLDLAVKLHAQGFDWMAFFKRWPITEPTPKGRWNYMGHVVNNAMAIKAPGLWWRLTNDDRDIKSTYDIINKLDKHHGMVTGVFTGDECLAGLDPTQGTELCAVVEYAYSLEILLSIVGDAAFGDRLEKILYNALPATFSPDMWTHQYDQQVNQVECSIQEEPDWNTNGKEANLFGLEPNYGCCAANLSQGWPKFAANLWMKPTDEWGLAIVAYAPSSIETEIGGVAVRASVETDYPFREVINITVETEEPISFVLQLRIPDWADGATITNGSQHTAAKPGGFHRIRREWFETTEFTLTLPMSARASRRHNNAISIERGPLVYALKMDEDWQRIHEDLPHRELPHADYEVKATSDWNYALDTDETTLEDDIEFSEHFVGDIPFSPDGAGVSAKIIAKKLPEWTMTDGVAHETPSSPVESDENEETITLIPFGCTNLRIAEFPVLTRNSGSLSTNGGNSMSSDSRSGQAPFEFSYRGDLRSLPDSVLENEVDLHGGFALDERPDFGHIYYGMPGSGILRIDPDMKKQELIVLPDNLTPLNFHSTKMGVFDGKRRLFLAANNDEMVAVITLDGEVDFVLPRPEFEQYQDAEVPFKPTDTALVENTLYVADGYGANYISTADVTTEAWSSIFGGKTESADEDGKFKTAHGIRMTHDHHHIAIADRPSARVQIHDFDGGFVQSHALPTGAWPCGIDYVEYQGRWLAVLGSLRDPVEDRPAPIYVVDAETFEVLSTIRPKEDLGLDLVQHLHNVIFHVHDDQLYLICQAWNPGFYFVLQKV